MSAILESVLDAQRRADCEANDAAMSLGRRIVPVHTGKIAIGIAYQPKPARVEGDAILLQRALLEPRTADPMPPVLRLFSFLWELA